MILGWEERIAELTERVEKLEETRSDLIILVGEMNKALEVVRKEFQKIKT